MKSQKKRQIIYWRLTMENNKLNLLDDFSVGLSSENANISFENYLSFLNVVNKLPKSELVKSGWLYHSEDIESLVPLFQNMQDENFQTLFRKSTSSNEALYSLWLSKISNKAKESVIKQNIVDFKVLTKEDLKNIAKLSQDESIINQLPSILSEYGVVLIYEQAIKSMKVDGAVFRLQSGHPVIAMSFRYSRLDNFWFTLLHELSHIVLHLEHLSTPIIDDLDEEPNSLIEKQANRLTKDSFVEKSVWRNCPPKYSLGDDIVISFAKDIGIHPAIIAGMLRYEKKKYTIYNDIINRVDVREGVFGNE